MTNNFFKKYIEKPTESQALNTKAVLLSSGTDVDFDSFRTIPHISEEFRVVSERAVVSDRSDIEPKSQKRQYIPDEILVGVGADTSVVKVCYSPKSLLTLVADNDEVHIVDKETKKPFPISVSLIKKPNYSYRKFEDGIPFGKYTSIVGLDRVTVIPYDGCFHWMDGKPCCFCGGNPTRLGFDGAKPNLFEAEGTCNRNYKKWWAEKREKTIERVRTSMQALLETDYPKPHFHFLINGGNLPDVDFEWEVFFEVLDALNDVVPFGKIDSGSSIIPPSDLNLVDELKERYSFDNIAFNLEVWGEQDFKEVCPGKSFYGFNNFVEALRYAVSTFGRGNVRTNFVLGAQSIEKTIQGVKELAVIGVVPDYSIFYPRPASIWNKKQPPSPDEILYFGYKVDEIYKQYGFRPVYCMLSSRSSIANEVGDLNGRIPVRI